MTSPPASAGRAGQRRPLSRVTATLTLTTTLRVTLAVGVTLLCPGGHTLRSPQGCPPVVQGRQLADQGRQLAAQGKLIAGHTTQLGLMGKPSVEAVEEVLEINRAR